MRDTQHMCVAMATVTAVVQAVPLPARLTTPSDTLLERVFCGDIETPTISCLLILAIWNKWSLVCIFGLHMWHSCDVTCDTHVMSHVHSSYICACSNLSFIAKIVNTQSEVALKEVMMVEWWVREVGGWDCMDSCQRVQSNVICWYHWSVGRAS